MSKQWIFRLAADENRPSSIQKETMIKDFFSSKKDYAYLLLLGLLLFNSVRPDMLLPGGKILMYLPTLLTALLLLQWITANKKEISNKQTRFVIGIIVLMIIQLPFVKNAGYSIMAIKNMFIYVFTSYLFVVQFLNSFDKLNNYIRLFTLLGVVFALLGIIGAGKISVPVLRDENDFCLLMNVLLPFAIFLGFNADNLRGKICYFSLALLYIVGNISTFSRGGFVGFVAVMVYVFFLSKRKIYFGVIICLLLIVGAIFAPQEYLNEIKSIDTQSYQRDTGATRVESWKAGWRMFLDHPVIGVGAYNFGVWHADYYDQDKNPEKMWGRVAHSLYFTLIPEMGLVGTLFFLGILWNNFKDYRWISSLEKRKTLYLAATNLSSEEKSKLSHSINSLYYISCACSGAMVAYLVTGFFISVLWYDYFWKLTSFAVATHNIAQQAKKLISSTQIAKN